jgi:hypothetical protein
VLRDRAPEDRPEVTAELRDGRTAVVPEGATVWDVQERQDLFHSTVAVRGDDENASRQDGRRRVGQSEDDVVVKLPLRPVGDQVVAAEAALDLVKQGAEDEAAGEVDYGIVHALMEARPRRGASTRPLAENRLGQDWFVMEKRLPQPFPSERAHRAHARNV